MSENWKTKLRDTKKANIEKIISWYESGLDDDRYSLKSLSKPQKELYRVLIKNVFKNCKNGLFGKYLIETVTEMNKKPKSADIFLSRFINMYLQNTNKFKCDKLNLKVEDLFTYFKIFKNFDLSSQALFSSIKLNEILNDGNYNKLVDIFKKIAPKNDKYAFFFDLVLTVYDKYYDYEGTFPSDIIFPDEKIFWNLYLKIISEYPFKQVNSLEIQTSLTLPDIVYENVKTYIEGLADNKEKMEVVENFLVAARSATLSKDWSIKEKLDKQFYDFLDEYTIAGKRVFKTYKFRTDFNKKLVGGELDDKELEEIDNCLTRNGFTFSYIIDFWGTLGNKSKKELLEATKKFINCQTLEIPKNESETGKGPIQEAAQTVGETAGEVAATVKTAAQQVLSATTDTSSTNAVFSSDKFINDILPHIQIFIDLNNIFLKEKNIDEVIDFIIKSDEQPISKFVEQYKDNKTLINFIKTIIVYQFHKLGCPINLQRIQLILKSAAREQRCIIPKEKRKPDEFLSIKEVNKVFPELLENSKLYRLISGNVIEGMIYINQGDEFNKFTEECRLQIVNNINAYFERCGQADFKNLSDIFKTNINVLIFNISKQKYDVSEFIYSGSKEEVVFLRNGVSFYVVTVDKKLKNPVGTFNSNMKDKNLVDNVLKEEIKGSSETTTVQSPSGTIVVQQQPGQAPTTEVITRDNEVITGAAAEGEGLKIIKEEFQTAKLPGFDKSGKITSGAPAALSRTPSFVSVSGNNELNGNEQNEKNQPTGVLDKILKKLLGLGPVVGST
jgi:hypothetical protein